MKLAELFSYGPETDIRRSGRPESYLFFAAAFTAILFLTHSSLLSTPYYWDEAGHFVPSALDLYREGRWIPITTTPNVHPPLVKALLAGLWQFSGPSIEVSRSLMLLIASLGVLGSFLLAIELSRHAGGSPAFLAVLLLLAAPLFFMQAMMVQLDMPAMTFTVWALFLFLRGRFVLCLVACALAALAKETAALVPVLLGLWLVAERRPRLAGLFVIPLLPLLAWLVYLRISTGHWFGDTEFTSYNVFYPLHPARLLASLVRRLVFLLLENYHWIGSLAVLAGFRAGLFQTRGWRIAIVFAVLHTVSVCILGGAILDRYLLPVLPLFYAAVAIGLSVIPALIRLIAAVALLTGLFLSLFWNPPLWPFPKENNLAMVRFAAVHKQTAAFLEANFSSRPVMTAWPMSIELARPEFGYVNRPFESVVELPDFRLRSLPAHSAPHVFVLFSREWNPSASIFREPLLGAFARRFLDLYEPIDGSLIERRYHLRRLIRFEQGSEWVEIYGP